MMSEYIFGPDLNNESEVVTSVAPYLSPVWGESATPLNVRIVNVRGAIAPDKLLPYGVLADIFSYGEPEAPWTHARVEVDRFTRSQAFTHPDNPNDIYYFTGLNYGTERGNELVLIRPGIDQVGDIGDIYLIERLMGRVSSSAGQTLVTEPDGTQFRQHSDSPLGAYKADVLIEKIQNTAKANRLWGRHAHIPLFRGMVEYSDSINDSAGGVYTLPLNISPIQLASLELTHYRYESIESSPYLQFAWQSGRFLRMMHNKGYAHNQYHTGNRALSILDWKLCAKDFETMQNISRHQNSTRLHSLSGASPKQSVLELDFFTCVSSDIKTALHIARKEYKGTSHIPLTAFLPEKLAYAYMHGIALKVAAANILGYTEPNSTINHERHLAETTRLTNLISRYSPSLADPLGIRNDAGYFTDALATGIATHTVRGEHPLQEATRQRPSRGKRRR
ncbi:hypothetical protein KC909_04275 [Candidatus Dojkabacteria bacterium]|uniref:Uncharacterized protein n=1 Tax=Candidatus Dojkabacteria bacterium TaxID=2099670 RepID=A0A955L6I3_9BACT|nr:hypothetical protein [Candidatus Dojkabacteria bacterium]